MGKYNAPALEKGLDILEFLSGEDTPRSQAEIASGVNRSPNEIYRMLVCLEGRGYLNKDPQSGRYTLSLKLYNISHRHTPVDALLKAAKPYMDVMSKKIRQACHLSTLYNGQLMVLMQSRSPGPVSLSIEEGVLFPLIHTNSGRLLLAHMNSTQQEVHLRQSLDFKGMKVDEQRRFREELDHIRTEGYAISESDITRGITDISVPIGVDEEGILAVLAVSSLTFVADKISPFASILRELKETAREIDRAIGA